MVHARNASASFLFQICGFKGNVGTFRKALDSLIEPYPLDALNEVKDVSVGLAAVAMEMAVREDVH